MKNRMSLLLMAVVLMGAQSHAALLEFTVDGTESWNGWMNSATHSQGWGTPELRANFSDDTTLFLQSNVNHGDAVAGDVGVLVMEANMYQEVTGAVGDIVTFDFLTVADDLTAAGYTAVGFIKVLDGGASWATTQHETVPLVAGTPGLVSLTVADAGAGSEIIQAGFTITGFSDTTGSGTAGLGVTVIPEPSTIGLVAVFGGGLLMFRRKLRR